MSKEREMLKKILATGWLNNELSCEVEELLAQPVQAPSVKLPDSEDEAVMMNLLSDNWLRHHAPHRLNQPEQEPVAWKVIDGTNGNYMFSRIKPTERSYKYDVVIPLYTAPPKREPFGPEERQRLSKAYSTRAEQVAFEEGIIFAEISYGIGGE